MKTKQLKNDGRKRIGVGHDGKRYMPVPLPTEYLNQIHDAMHDHISEICGEGQTVRMWDKDNTPTNDYEQAVLIVNELVIISEDFMDNPLIVQYGYSRTEGITSLHICGAYEISNQVG